MVPVHESDAGVERTGVSRHLTPAQAIALVPAWRGLDPVVEEAFTGLTNRSFRLRVGDEAFVMRLDAAHTSVLRPDRTAERVALEQAGTTGTGPEVIFAAPEQGILVTRYVAGSTLTDKDLRNTATLERIAALLQRVHALPVLGTGFDIVVAAESYLAALPESGDTRRIGEQCVRIVEALQSGAEIRCCHNDVIAPNIVDSDSLVLIDWEYAGDNDAYFDLASLIAYHRLESRYADTLLSAYAGDAAAVDNDRLEAQLRLYDALHWLWLSLREAVSPSAEQREQLERLGRRLSLP